eukprot:CAMPEP_0198121926 /NCGR_PEP_ID=MMETSP1442-20131203/33433_1 /TAXON_ID= /ORGANISM="Craspedostauros australis, Strain CCMP3328" /LENGTH=178 /DNA_ID=CAMNT_0043780827 /DNA_START=381 /DNA_END=913 /DNA_ORIENTATION=-
MIKAVHRTDSGSNVHSAERPARIYAEASMASITCWLTSSISNALSGGNGRLRPSSSMTGSSTPLTRTTKLPLPGFSGLTSTEAMVPTALTILFARVLNADHCLHASMVTTIEEPALLCFLEAELLVSVVAVVVAVVVFFVVFDGAAAFLPADFLVATAAFLVFLLGGGAVVSAAAAAG